MKVKIHKAMFYINFEINIRINLTAFAFVFSKIEAKDWVRDL